MKSNLFKFLIAGFAGVALVSCDGENPFGGESEAEAKLSEYYINTEAAANTIFTYVDLSCRDSSLTNDGDTVNINGAIVSLSSGTITVDFGTGTLGPDNAVRKGSISFAKPSDYLANGTIVDATLNNYFKDDKSLSGSIKLSVENIDFFAQEVSLGLEVNNLTFNDEFKLSIDKQIDWNLGFFSFTDLSDDSYSVSGTASGEEIATGYIITTTIDPTEALFYDRTCEYGMVSGIIDISLVGDSLSFTSGAIDFIAADTCSNVATITLNGTEGQSVTIPQTFDSF